MASIDDASPSAWDAAWEAAENNTELKKLDVKPFQFDESEPLFTPQEKEELFKISSNKGGIAALRKNTPVFSGVLNYFPDAIRAVSQCSFAGNEQHNPGKPLHWDRAKSGDELDALTRHLLEAGTVDTDGIRHSTKVAWRALANLQKELEKAGEKW